MVFYGLNKIKMENKNWFGSENFRSKDFLNENEIKNDSNDKKITTKTIIVIMFILICFMFL